MGQIKDLYDVFKSSHWSGLAGLQVRLRFLGFFFELRGLGRERVLVHGPGEVGVEQTLLLGFQVG
ncbi:MAG: hypothetical protein GC159_13330 [Phycisphaera sp.]|nr:hypothetical protein [Phycisphaera sp.]